MERKHVQLGNRSRLVWIKTQSTYLEAFLLLSGLAQLPIFLLSTGATPFLCDDRVNVQGTVARESHFK
jgi:hypothetical protein